MSATDEYLTGIAEPEKAEIERIRSLTKQIVPGAEEGQSYGMPAFKYNNKPLLGFIVAKKHLSLFPFSPEVVDAVKDKLEDYELSKGTIRFTVENPIPESVIKEIIRLRLIEIDR